jgi:hypothetical protein
MDDFINTCSSSSDTLRQRMLVRSWILELRSNKKKTLKRIKCGARYENSVLQYQANMKRICE